MNTKASSQFFKTYILLPLIFCTLVTGASGLMYEVSWHRYLANLCGSQAKATALILSIFLGGLSFGYFLFGFVSKYFSARRSLILYAFVEAAIGLYAFLFPSLYDYALGSLASGSAHFYQDAFICILLIGFPTSCMGSTIPLLTRAFSGDPEETAKAHAIIYGSNTAGAFIGVLLAGFYFLPEHGLSYTLIMAACGNGVGALLILIVAALYKDGITESDTASSQTKSTKAQRIRLFKAIAISFLCGYAALALQTVLIRMTGLAFGSSEHAFSMVVASYVLLLAVGSFLVAGPLGKIRHLWMHLSATILFCTLLYLTLPYWGYMGHHIRIFISSIEQAQLFYFAMLFIFISSLLFFPIGALGATLPLLFREESDGDDRSGEDAGYLYAANTLGCIAGASIGGYYLLYWINLDQVFLTALAALFLALLISLPVMSLSFHRGIAAFVVCGSLLVAGLSLPQWDRKTLSIGYFRMQSSRAISFLPPLLFEALYKGHYKIIFSEDGPNTTVSVSESEDNKHFHSDSLMPGRAVAVNGKVDGATYGGDRATTKLLAYLPLLLLNEEPERVAVIGYGTGITPGTMAWYQWVKHLDVIEISPLIKKAAPFFSPYNMNADSNGKLTWNITDAYRFLARRQNTYNVIISEPSNPWVVGVERLYTKEFLERAKQRLTPDGMYVQWVQLYSFSEESLAIVVKTFSEVFPHVRMFQTGMDLIILGTEKPLTISNIQTAKERSKVTLIQRDLESIGIPSLEAFFGTEVPLPVKYYSNVPQIHTLERPVLSYRASLDMFIEASINLQRLILLKTSYHPWHAFGVRQSLLSYYIQTLDDEQEYLRSLKIWASSVCPMAIEDLVIPPNIKDLPRNCQSALITLAALGELEPEAGIMSERDMNNLRHIFARFRNEPIKSAGNLEVAKYGINVLNSVITPYAQFSPEDINLIFSACYDSTHETALQCQKSLVSLFVQLGYHDDAYDAYQRLIMNAPKDKNWKTTFARMEKALDTLTKLPEPEAEPLVPPFFALNKIENE